MVKPSLTRMKILAATCLALAVAFFFDAYQLCWLGKFSFDAVPSSPAIYAGQAPDFRAAVLQSEYTARFLGTARDYEAHIHYWQELLQQLMLPCDSISDAQLESDLKRYRLLVLPSAVCLSTKETANIRAFLNEGGGVICTWAAGTRDEQGNWKGWDFLRELTGADSFRRQERAPPWFISFAAGSPTTAGVPAGTRAQVASPERLEATVLDADAYWSDARLFPVDSTRTGNFQAAALHRQLERGRVVWYGFQENSAVAGGNDKAILNSALGDGVAWASQRALVTLNPWPSPYAAAAILALDVGDDYENAAYAADRLLREQAKGTFFCPADTLKKNPELMRNLEGAGEVALEETPPTFPGAARVVPWMFHIESSRWKLWRLGGTWAAGLDSLQAAFSSQALRALAGARFRYYLVSAEGNSVLPVILRISQSAGIFHRRLELVQLARMTDDDLHLSPFGVMGLDPQWIVQRLLSDFEIVSGLGGLYILSYHTQGLSSPEYAGVLSTLVGQLRSHGTWVTTADEVAGWWAKRSKLSIRISSHEPGALRLTLACHSKGPIEGVALSIFPPTSLHQARVIPAGAGAPPSQAISEPSDGRIKLTFGKIDPGGPYEYELKLNP